MEMSQLLTQPPEILHNILQQVDPEDLASLSKTCQTLRHFIQNDRLLWKSQYLRHFVSHPSPILSSVSLSHPGVRIIPIGSIRAQNQTGQKTSTISSR
jgi:hypothetical protein